ncbi:MAG: response regulator transcription factor [Pseudomonadota bacterium]
MIVIVEEREMVREAYQTQFARQGFATEAFSAAEFGAWCHAAGQDDLEAITACLVAEEAFEYLTETFPAKAALQNRLKSPLLVLMDRPALESIITCFDKGADDVLRKPMHVREILARISNIASRGGLGEVALAEQDQPRLQVFLDGRDPQVDGEPLLLPRRERRILEYLHSIGERRATKPQIYNAIYGLFNETVEETVVESHISKLRKKLRTLLGYDPIDSRRFLGYRLVLQKDAPCAEAPDVASDIEVAVPQKAIAAA